jgi:hypothetical protein
VYIADDIISHAQQPPFLSDLFIMGQIPVPNHAVLEQIKKELNN